MKKWFQQAGPHFKDRSYLSSFIGGWLLLFASLVVSYFAALYATKEASNAVTDIILSNIPVFDLHVIFLYGPLVFWIFATAVSLYKPARAPFVLKSIALFIVIRAAFISLTHIGPFPIPASTADISSLISTFFYGGDLFFSGHTGLPFLLALIYWDRLWLRRVFTAMAVFFGAVVLLAHLHYSIDVLSAFFITYAIYKLAVRIFKKEYGIFSAQ